jgi:hypothetical protein
VQAVVLGRCLQSISGGVAAEVEVVPNGSLENRRVETRTEEKGRTEKDREGYRRNREKKKQPPTSPSPLPLRYGCYIGGISGALLYAWP